MARLARFASLLVPVAGALFWGYVATASAGATAAEAHVIDLTHRDVGVVRFTDLPGHATAVRYELHGLPPGFHAFHIHRIGACDAQHAFAGSGEHYDSLGRLHPFDGDMPVVLINRNGRGRGSFVTRRFELRDVVGMVVIVHDRADNYANIPIGPRENDYTPNTRFTVKNSLRTGNSGLKIACGVIRRVPSSG